MKYKIIHNINYYTLKNPAIVHYFWDNPITSKRVKSPCRYYDIMLVIHNKHYSIHT